MPSQVLVLTVIAILQWLSVHLAQWFHQRFNPELSVGLGFDPTTFLLGNLQIIFVLWVYQLITKYVKL